MSASRRKRAEDLFQVAADLSREERTHFLGAECGSDVSLRAEVERLLAVVDGGDAGFMRPLAAHERPTRRQDGTVAPRRRQRPPEMIGHYRVEREIGRGGMGMVYLAVDEKLDRRVAIKLLPDEFSHDPQRLALFEREARTAAQLNHPNVATIYELGEIDSSYFIAMEYVEGCLLSALLERPEPVSLSEFLDVAIQIAEGLTAAHDSSVVHRDLKPGNLMITGEARVKILDFGLAKALPSDTMSAIAPHASGEAGAGSTCFGTVGYSSPEQCRGEPVDLRSDLFSFGVVLYELATGVAPFKRTSLPETITAVLHEDPEPPAMSNWDLPMELSSLIGRLLEKRPEDRYQSSAEVLAEFRAMQREVEARGRARLVWAALATLGVVVTGAVSLWIGSQEKPVSDPMYAEASGHILRGEIPEAKEVLARLETQWGRNEEVEILWAHLETRVDDLVAESQRNHRMLLALGDLDGGAERVDEICGLDEARCVPARDLLDEALALRTRTETLDEEGRDLLERDHLADAWERVAVMGALRFRGGETFAPAVARAEELGVAVAASLETRAARLVASATVSVEEIEATMELLREVDASSQHIPGLERRVVQHRLREQRRLATSGMSPGALREIVRGMERLDPEARETREVRGMYERRYRQRTIYRLGVEEFGEASTPGLVGAIERFAAERSELPSGAADEEAAGLAAGLEWLEGYELARGHLDGDLGAARRLHDELDPDDLPRDFREAARAHLAALGDQILRWEGRAIARKVEQHSDVRRLTEAQAALRTLEALGAPGIDQEVEDARAAVDTLREEEDEWAELETEYVGFRRLLERRMLPDARLSLRRLQSGWGAEGSRLDAALALERELAEREIPAALRRSWGVFFALRPREDLRRRRAVLSVRLGEYESAVERLGDAYRLLRAQARLAPGPTLDPADPAAPRAALADVEHVIATVGPDATALYLRAVCRHLLSRIEGGEDLLTAARTDLVSAIDEHGLDSADARYRLATIHLEQYDRTRDGGASEAVLAAHLRAAVASATAALVAGVTEAELIVTFGGLGPAVEGDAMRRFRRDILLRRADGRFLTAMDADDRGDERRGALALCIEDCTEAIQLDEKEAYSYFLRGFAEGEAGRYADALDDLRRARDLVPGEARDARARQVRDGVPILIRRYRDLSSQSP
jgi:predicted Ser/Thr protein kinase/tetratricopeptide (TPR) repeat protein